MATTTLTEKCRQALRVVTTAYDGEINFYIDSAKLDLKVAGVVVGDNPDALVEKAILTYARMNFGSPANYDELEQSYKEQKATLMNATGYTDWGDVE